ncbi:MAG TPA: hypothetical protein VGH54_09645 [Mycobacterium sp.]|uniref:hypothetical protein n=1 Tax=Mycobacterium sp. TaxID=1785 RepID=UPI002F40926E
MTTTCKHREVCPENVMLPDDVALEHFDQCFTPERRMEAWTWMRERSELGTRCLMADHDGLLHELRWSHDRIVTLTRELGATPRRKAARVAYRSRARRRTRRTK